MRPRTLVEAKAEAGWDVTCVPQVDGGRGSCSTVDAAGPFVGLGRSLGGGPEVADGQLRVASRSSDARSSRHYAAAPRLRLSRVVLPRSVCWTIAPDRARRVAVRRTRWAVSVGALTGLDEWSLDHLMLGRLHQGGTVHPRIRRFRPFAREGRGHETRLLGEDHLCGRAWVASVDPRARRRSCDPMAAPDAGVARLAGRLGLALACGRDRRSARRRRPRHALLATTGAERIHVSRGRLIVPRASSMDRALVSRACTWSPPRQSRRLSIGP